MKFVVSFLITILASAAIGLQVGSWLGERTVYHEAAEMGAGEWVRDSDGKELFLWRAPLVIEEHDRPVEDLDFGGGEDVLKRSLELMQIPCEEIEDLPAVYYVIEDEQYTCDAGWAQ